MYAIIWQYNGKPPLILHTPDRQEAIDYFRAIYNRSDSTDLPALFDEQCRPINEKSSYERTD